MRHLLPLLCLLAQPALADGSIIVSPVYSQLVAVAVPSDFKAGYEAAQDGHYILELVPKDETVDKWSQIITLTGAEGLAEGSHAMDIATQIAQGYQAACPETFAARSLPAPQIKGAVEAFSGWVGCGNASGHAEAMVFLVVKGKKDVYTVQWAEQGKAMDKAPTADPSLWRPRADAQALTRICDKVAGEQAPYPSCTQ